MIPSITFLSNILKPRLTDQCRRLCTSSIQQRKCSGKKEEVRCGEEAKPCAGTKKKSKSCDKGQGKGRDGGWDDARGDASQICSQQIAQECAKKIAELQKQWETLAKQAEAQAKQAEQIQNMKKTHQTCQVKGPKKDEEKGGRTLPMVLGLVAILIGVWYYYLNQQPEEPKEGEEEEKTEV